MKLLDARLLQQVPRVRRLLLLAGLLSAVGALATVAQAVVLARLIVRVFVDRWGMAGSAELLQWLALVFVARAALAWLSESTAARASSHARSDLRKAVLSAVAHGGPAVTRRVEPAELAVLATKGIDSLDVYFSKVLPLVTVACTAPLAALAVIGYQDHLSLGIICATVPLVPFFMVLVGRETQIHTNRQWQAMARLARHLLDVLSGLVTLHIFGRAKAQSDALRDSGQRYRKTTMKVLRISFLSTLVLELLSTLSIALVAVSIGLRLVNGRMSLLAGLTVLLLAPEVYQPLRTLGTQFHAAADGLEAAGKALDVIDVIDTAQEVDAGGDEGVVPNDAHGISIDIDALCFEYDDGTRVLDGVSAHLAAGALYVLRGASGIGKTTLLHLLLGFLQPTNGRIQVCGSDLSGVDAHWWRAQVAYVPQRPWLPSGDVRQALSMVAPRATEAQMLESLAAAGLRPGDAALPLGLETPLFDAGAGVSVGQMRRIAVARASLLRRPVLLLDEPTAGLDAAAEQQLVESVRLAADAGALVIVVSHSEVWDAAADSLIDLEAVRV